MERLSSVFILVLGFFVSMTSQASTCTVKSPEHKVALLELYTSEGCSSCPPADKWLSQLAEKGVDSDHVVPLSLHVDYWNYIGWQDPYSSAQYTDRQKEIAWRNHLRTIYTPQMVLQGLDFRSWRRVDFTSLLKSVNNKTAIADIRLAITPSSPRVLSVTAEASVRNPELYQGGRLVLAIFENGLVSSVTAGENDGRELKHDYVVRKMYSPESLSEKGSTSKTLNIIIPPEWDNTKTGIAAFIEHPQHGTLQAVASKLSCG